MEYTQRLTALPNGIDRQEIIKADTDTIVSAVCQYYELNVGSIRATDRKKDMVMARHFIHYYLVVSERSRLEISRVTLRDPGTVTWSRNMIENWVETDKLFRARAYAIGALIISKQQSKSLIQSLKKQTA